MIRSKAIHVEGTEKNSKYFANLEKRHAEKKNISKSVIDGIEITENEKILQEEVKFYRKLYTKTPQTETDINFFEEDNNKLTTEEKDMCEGILTENERK